MDRKLVLSLPFLSWLKVWIRDLSANRRILTTAAFLTPFALGMMAIISNKVHKSLKDNGFWFILLPFYVGLWYWFLSAPDIRFGYMYILTTVSIGLAGLFLATEALLDQQKFVPIVLNGVQVFVLLFLIQLLIRSINIAELREHWINPSDYPKMPTEVCQMGNFEVFCAQSNSECWYEPFPCVPKADKHVFLRGKTYQEGFYSTK